MNRKLIENNYIVIPNFISSYRAVEFASEFKEFCEKNKLSGDSQAPNSYSKYNYISFLELLCEKTQEVSSILEETVLPTYSYSRVYLNGSILEKHIDRDACEISLTVHLNGDKPWPIYIKTPSQEERKVILNPGDALMYLGKIAEHWREQYDGDYYSQVFLHYVRSRGDCSYTYFDKQKENENIEENLEKTENKITKNDDQKIKNETPKSPTLIVSGSRTKLEDYIHVFDDILTAENCNLILNEYINSNEWTSTLIGNEGIVDKTIRNCDQIFLTDEEIIRKNYDIRKKIDQILFESHMKCVEKYSEIHPYFKIDIDTGYQLLRYEEGGFYSQHVDSFKQQQRSISCSIQLNEDYDGGEFAFFDREIIIRALTGSAIVFPSNFMYPHEVMPVLRGTRYSTVSWFV